MQGHIDKAKDNEKFHLLIESNFADDFHDWRITVLFYSALHYINAYLKFKKSRIGHTHKELDKIICKEGSCPLPENIYDMYSEMQTFSREARYNIFTPTFKVLLLSTRCEETKNHLNNLKKHFSSQGMKI